MRVSGGCMVVNVLGYIYSPTCQLISDDRGK